MKTVNKDHKVK